MIVDAVLAKIFGTKTEREIKEMLPTVAAISALEPAMRDLSDIDLAEGVVRCTGKGAKQRIVPMGKSSTEATRIYLQRGRPYLGRLQRGDVLFLNHRGQGITRQAQDDPIIYLYHVKWLWAYTPKLKGFKAIPDGMIRLKGLTLG